MRASPVQIWRGSTTYSGHSRSHYRRILNAAIVLCGVTYLLYIILLAADPRPLLRASHNAYRLRVRVRSSPSSATAADQAGQQAHLTGKVYELREQPRVVPGGNQAPLLSDDLQQDPSQHQVQQDPMAIVAGDDGSGAAGSEKSKELADGQGSTGSMSLEQDRMLHDSDGEDGSVDAAEEAAHSATLQQQRQEQQQQRQQQQQQQQRQKQEQERQGPEDAQIATDNER